MEWMQIQIFYNGLSNATKQMLDAPTAGSLCNKQPSATVTLIQEMTNNGYQWSAERSKPVNSAGIYQVDTVTTLTAQVEEIAK